MNGWKIFGIIVLILLFAPLVLGLLFGSFVIGTVGSIGSTANRWTYWINTDDQKVCYQGTSPDIPSSIQMTGIQLASNGNWGSERGQHACAAKGFPSQCKNERIEGQMVTVFGQNSDQCDQCKSL